MASTTQRVISLFLSRQNYEMLRQLMDRFGIASSGDQVGGGRHNLVEAMRLAAEQYGRDMLGSDPIGGVEFQLDSLNAEFMRNLQREETSYQPYYHVGETTHRFIDSCNDGTRAATQQTNGSVATAPANSLLTAWQMAPRRSLGQREDTAGETGDRGAGRFVADKRFEVAPTIEYCDQSAVGRNWAVDDFQQRIVGHSFNRESRGYVGDGAAATNERLMAMRDRLPPGVKIEYGSSPAAQPVVAAAEVRLQRRAIDRDISEGVTGVERDFMIHRHDMGDIRRRTDHQRAYAAAVHGRQC